MDQLSVLQTESPGPRWGEGCPSDASRKASGHAFSASGAHWPFWYHLMCGCFTPSTRSSLGPSLPPGVSFSVSNVPVPIRTGTLLIFRPLVDPQSKSIVPDPPPGESHMVRTGLGDASTQTVPELRSALCVHPISLSIAVHCLALFHALYLKDPPSSSHLFSPVWKSWCSCRGSRTFCTLTRVDGKR